MKFFEDSKMRGFDQLRDYQFSHSIFLAVVVRPRQQPRQEQFLCKNTIVRITSVIMILLTNNQ